MVKSRLCETARLAFFSARPRLSHFLNCKTETFEISEHCGKNWDSETSNLLKKRDCETLEIRLKFCETQIFWRTIRHPDHYAVYIVGFPEVWLREQPWGSCDRVQNTRDGDVIKLIIEYFYLLFTINHNCPSSRGQNCSPK